MKRPNVVYLTFSSKVKEGERSWGRKRLREWESLCEGHHSFCQEWNAGQGPGQDAGNWLCQSSSFATQVLFICWEIYLWPELCHTEVCWLFALKSASGIPGSAGCWPLLPPHKVDHYQTRFAAGYWHSTWRWYPDCAQTLPWCLDFKDEDTRAWVAFKGVFWHSLG